MSLRAVLPAVALLLLLVPPVQADGNVTLVAQQTSTGGSVPSGPVAVEIQYELELAVSGDVELLSVVETSGTRIDHEALWSGLGSATTRSTTRTTTATVNGLPVDQVLEFTIQFNLPASAGAGTYDLRAYVRQRGTTGGNAALTDIDVAATKYTLARPAAGGGGAGAFDSAIGPVTGLTAGDVEATSLRLSWDALPNAGLTYQIYRSTQAGFEPSPATLVRTTTATQVTDSGLQPETTYHYRVRGLDGGDRIGPFSPELAVRTSQGLDTTPPAAVQGLRVTRTTEQSVALAWSAAEDDRAVISYTLYRGAPGFTPSASNRLTSTSALAYTDTTVAPSTTYSYVVRAVDVAGNIGPPSASVEARTAVDPTAAAPSITRIVLVDSGNGWRLQWATDEPATGTVQLTGSGVQRSVQVGSGATFSAILGDLPIGEYAYDITAAGVSGHTGQKSGRFIVEAGLHGRWEAIGDPVADALATRVGVQLDGAAIYFVDTDLDGTFERIVDADGRLALQQAFPEQRQFLVSAHGTWLLLGSDGAIDPVQRVAASVVERETGEAVHRVTVRIADKSGWLMATLDDPSPERPLLGIERADGTQLPAGSTWRAGSKVHFIDDPAQDYVLLFDNSPAARSAGGDRVTPDWLPYAAACADGTLNLVVR